MKSSDFDRVFNELQRYRILLVSDPRLPSVAGILANQPIHGSWWGHPKGHAIFRVNELLTTHRDVLVLKLVSEKNTLVYRTLWPALFAVVSARHPWQLNGLSSAARSLLGRVEREGRVRIDQVPSWRSRRRLTIRDASQELEKRLLVYGESVHTDSGAHAKQLETWELYARRKEFTMEKISQEAAMAAIEAVVSGLNKQFAAKGRLPWNLI